MPETWIVPADHRKLTPNRYHAGNRPALVLPVELVVIHYTAAAGESGSLAWLTNTQAMASAHFLIGRSGELWELAPLEDRTWHAGGASSRWRGQPPNPRSIGIELANVGPLTKRPAAGEPDRLVDANGRVFTGEVFTAPDGGLWEAFPEAQLAALDVLARELLARFPALAEALPPEGQLPRWCGHADVDPKRKVDPGPAFPWARIRAIVEAEVNRHDAD